VYKKLNEVKFDEALAHLHTVINVFHTLKIGNGIWKPIQTGVILVTTTLIEITQECLDDHHFQFVLTGRLNQDALENLCYVVRLKKPLPTPLDFRRALKQICVSQFLYVPMSSNYHIDDSEYLADFLSACSVSQPVESCIVPDDVNFVLDDRVQVFS
jgi:hypothetical protein